MLNITDEQRAECLRSIMSVPVGANKRFLVKQGGDPFAGFDDLKGAQAYVAHQTAHAKYNCAKMSWSIQDRGN